MTAVTALGYALTLDSDPTVDNTAALAAQLAEVPDGTPDVPAHVVLPAGRFRVDGTALISKRNHLRIWGNGCTLWTDRTGVEVGITDRNGNSTRQHFTLSGCTDVTVTGLRVEGCRTDRDASDPRFGLYQDATAFEHAYAIQGACSDVTLAGCTLANCGGDGVYVGGTGVPNRNVTIQRVTGDHPGRQSLGIVHVDGLLVEDTTILWGGRSGLDVEPNHATHFVRDATFRRVVMGSQFYPFVVGGTVPLSGSEQATALANKRQDVELEDCVGLYASSAHPALLASRTGSGLTVRRHTDTRQRTIYALNLNGWDGVAIEDCHVTSGKATPTTYGANLTACTGALSITGSDFGSRQVGATKVPGADQLYLNAAATVAHAGNRWGDPTDKTD